MDAKTEQITIRRHTLKAERKGAMVIARGDWNADEIIIGVLVTDVPNQSMHTLVRVAWANGTETVEPYGWLERVAEVYTTTTSETRIGTLAV